MSLADLHAVSEVRRRDAYLFKTAEPAPNGKRIVLYSADPWKLGVFEQFLHLAFQLKGHRPVSIYYDGFTLLSPWENHCTVPPPPEKLVQRYGFIFECFGIEGVAMSAYLDREAAQRRAEALVAGVEDGGLNSLSYRRIPVGRLARRDLFQFTHGHFEADDPETAALYRRHLVHAVVSVDLAYAIVERERPNIVVLVCGKGVMYSYLYEVCRLLDIQATTWEEGMYFDDSLIIAHNARAIDFPVDPEDWEVWRRRPLPAAELARVDTYFEKWRNQTATSWVYYDNEMRDFERMRAALDIPPGRRIVSLFSNIIWDTNALERDDAFDGMMDWIHTTIDLLAGREDAILVLRAHPGEARLVYKTRTTVRSLVETAYGGIPPHVRIVDGRSEFSSYEIARHSDRCAVYTSTLGIELTLMGLQPLVCGVAYYARKGATNDIRDKEQYARLIRGQDTPRGANPALLKKFMHLLLFHRLKRPEFYVGMYKNDPQQPRIRIDSFAGWPESMPVFNQVMEDILAGRSFVHFEGSPPAFEAAAAPVGAAQSS